MNKKGFTLIELLVVIAIIGLLSTLAVVALGSARQKARDSKRLSDLKQIQTALELFYTDNNSYPVASTSIELGVAGTTCLDVNGWDDAPCAGTLYMGLVPKEPSPNVAAYEYTSNGATYSITATLEGVINDLSGAIVASQNGLAMATST
jgi:general secretion pathway protein G